MAICNLDFDGENDTILLVTVCNLLRPHLHGDALAEVIEIEVDLSEAGELVYETLVHV